MTFTNNDPVVIGQPGQLGLVRLQASVPDRIEVPFQRGGELVRTTSRTNANAEYLTHSAMSRGAVTRGSDGKWNFDASHSQADSAFQGAVSACLSILLDTFLATNQANPATFDWQAWALEIAAQYVRNFVSDTDWYNFLDVIEWSAVVHEVGLGGSSDTPQPVVIPAMGLTRTAIVSDPGTGKTRYNIGLTVGGTEVANVPVNETIDTVPNILTHRSSRSGNHDISHFRLGRLIKGDEPEDDRVLPLGTELQVQRDNYTITDLNVEQQNHPGGQTWTRISAAQRDADLCSHAIS